MADIFVLVLFAAILAADDAPPAEIDVYPGTVARFASAEEGRQILTADDAFTASLSRFDLQCRLKTSKEVQLADWKEFVAKHVQAWEKAEIETIKQSLERLKKRLDGYRLPLPPVVRLVRTTGDEEAGAAAYTRGTAIVVPINVTKYDATRLDRLLAHELFHLMSRHDGAVRARLYRLIGFELCEPIDLPPSLASRRITNPDAPLIDCTISLTAASGRKFTGAPVLYAQARQYDPAAGKTLFQLLIFRLLVVERRGERFEPVLRQSEPVVIDAPKESAFFDKVGKNTNYIIHPDEILADNFVHLIMEDRDLATPRIIDEMRQALGNN